MLEVKTYMRKFILIGATILLLSALLIYIIMYL